MSTTRIPTKTQNLLWAISAGRCEYAGCNTVLYQDLLTSKKVNKAYIAHIHADEIGGPRYDDIKSPKLEKDISNLMLMCDTHHRLIDKEDVAGHPVDLLISMKEKHEKRIRLLTSYTEDLEIRPIIYEAPIGVNMVRVARNLMKQAIYKHGSYPSDEIIDLSRLDCDKVDSEKDFWAQRMESLDRRIKLYIDDALTRASEVKYALFGFAPIPLLVYLGNRLRDLTNVQVFQFHRDLNTWDWMEYPEGFEFISCRPNHENVSTKNIALVLAVSADINDERITAVLGDDVDIWKITVTNTGYLVVRHPDQLSQFRERLRWMFNEIKKVYGEGKEIHLFSAIPLSIAVEVGRVRNPKSDLPMVLYDNQKKQGFIRAFKIK